MEETSGLSGESNWQLHEILSILDEGGLTKEELKNKSYIQINIFPPTSACGNITDEDSEEDDYIILKNLPEKQLLAPAEINDVTLDLSTEESEADAVPSLLASSNQGPPTLLAQTSSTQPFPSSTQSSKFSKKCQARSPSPPSTQSSKFSKKCQARSPSPPKIPKRTKLAAKEHRWIKQDLQNTNIIFPKVDTVHNNLSPLEIFFLFFDRDVINHIQEFSNKYAAYRNRCGDISVDEIYTFLGILILSGYNSVPRRRMYWETYGDCNNIAICKAMSRDRFEFIMSNFHVCDSNNIDKTDRYAKVRPLYNMLNQRFLEYAPHEENHSIGESVVPYFGPHRLKDIIKGYPTRYGYKIWIGATHTGYIVWKDLYQESSTLKPEYKDLGLGASVVLEYADIVSKIGKFPFHFYFNNFFSGLPLITELTNRGFKVTCAIQENRIAKCPLNDIKKEKRGTYDYRLEVDKHLLLVKWNDNNIVTLASNACGINPIHEVERFSKILNKKVKIDQPHIVHCYNAFVGGIHKYDKNMSLCYRISIQGNKWYFPLITDSIDSAIQNAWQLYRQSEGNMDQLAFRRRISMNLLETYGRGEGNRIRNIPSSINVDSRYDGIDHLVVPQNSQTRCKHCHMKCTTRCKKCNIGLHVKCFIAYHSK